MSITLRETLEYLLIGPCSAQRNPLVTEGGKQRAAEKMGERGAPEE